MTETPVKPYTDPDADPDTEPEIDEELLAEAMRGVGTRWRNRAINAALAEYVLAKRARRRQALENLRKMSDEGVFDYDALDEVDQ
jgi:Arc/MetJ family transcription regulator